MKDVTKELIPELASLVEEFKKLDELHTAAVKALRRKMPRIAGHCTDNELRQIINIVTDIIVESNYNIKG